MATEKIIWPQDIGDGGGGCVGDGGTACLEGYGGLK